MTFGHTYSNSTNLNFCDRSPPSGLFSCPATANQDGGAQQPQERQRAEQAEAVGQRQVSGHQGCFSTWTVKPPVLSSQPVEPMRKQKERGPGPGISTLKLYECAEL